MLVEKESSPFVEHVDAALKWTLYSDSLACSLFLSVFHFINIRLTKGLIKVLADERRIGVGSANPGRYNYAERCDWHSNSVCEHCEI